MFSLTIANKDTGAAICTDGSSGCNDWRVPNDGLDGFGSMPFSVTEAELATLGGGVVLGAHSGIRQLTVKLEAPPTATKRDEAYKTFTVGSAVAITATYIRSDSRTISGIVTACKVNEGNIYEPTTVTATIDCMEPTFKAVAASTLEANGYTVGSGTAGYTWSVQVGGDAMAKLDSVTLPFTTTNTATVTLAKQATVTLIISRTAASSSYNVPIKTVLVWQAGPAKGTSIEAATDVVWKVWFDGDIPICSYNGTNYGIGSATTNKWAGVGAYELFGGQLCTVSLLVSMSANIAPQSLSTERGIMTYTPEWQGI